MLIRVASDLHLEAFYGSEIQALEDKFLPKDERDQSAVLVLAGDICSRLDLLEAFLKRVQHRFQKVFYVPGNHEAYKYDLNDWNARFSALQLENVCSVHLSETRVYEHEGVKFILSTLWGDGGPTVLDQETVHFYLNDFRLISLGDRKFDVKDMIACFKKNREEIEKALDGSKAVVVTHHLPSRRLVSARFWPHDGSDGANGGFVGNCENLLATKKPTLWIHGHTHDTLDMKLWQTRVVCNPCGYRGEWNSPFTQYSTKFVEI